MRPVEFLRYVRDGEDVDPAWLQAFVDGVTSGEIPDYQATAFLMAVFQRGLSPDATVALTMAMRDSGQVLDLTAIPGAKVDKHSTGGVGDKISIALAPLVAACGVVVPMVSGRGLGHTGGTLDKLEAIPGFRVDLSLAAFKDQLGRLGIGLVGQTGELAPADRKLYALRDVTATVESVPLITSSILAKKLAAGIDALVLDVKVGRGAFMKTVAQARQLAQSLVRVGEGAGIQVRALLTRMEEPLGRTVGNALETREAIEILQGHGPEDSTELTLALGCEMLLLGGLETSREDARRTLRKAIASGTALKKLREVIAAQQGDEAVVEDFTRLPTAPVVTDVTAPRAGFVAAVDSYALGLAAMHLGAGRQQASDKIDPAVGVELLVKSGERVERGQVLARVHERQRSQTGSTQVARSFVVSDDPPTPSALIIDRIESGSPT